MKEGKKVKRRIWSNGKAFINKKKIFVRFVSFNDIWETDYLDIPFACMPWVDGDILANDWEEVEGCEKESIDSHSQQAMVR